jgi:hypothetical protein
MPHTVPKRPINGAILAVVASHETHSSNLLTSTTDARMSDRSRADKLFKVGRGAAGLGLDAIPGSGDDWRS